MRSPAVTCHPGTYCSTRCGPPSQRARRVDLSGSSRAAADEKKVEVVKSEPTVSLKKKQVVKLEQSWNRRCRRRGGRCYRLSRRFQGGGPRRGPGAARCCRSLLSFFIYRSPVGMSESARTLVKEIIVELKLTHTNSRLRFKRPGARARDTIPGIVTADERPARSIFGQSYSSE